MTLLYLPRHKGHSLRRSALLPITVGITRFRVPDVKAILSAAVTRRKARPRSHAGEVIGEARLAGGRLLDRPGTTGRAPTAWPRQV
jgi:hypothetical protein